MAEQPHVLVVDDDAKIAAALRRALIYEGYQVEVAPDGHIALARARDRMPDLAILDIMMPGIDGLEVTRRLRAEGDVPILLLTAKDGMADRVKGLDSGADDYLVKPFAYEELLARVRALLRRRAPRARRTLRRSVGRVSRWVEQRTAFRRRIPIRGRIALFGAGVVALAVVVFSVLVYVLVEQSLYSQQDTDLSRRGDIYWSSLQSGAGLPR